jgi:hypothetical protein
MCIVFVVVFVRINSINDLQALWNINTIVLVLHKLLIQSYTQQMQIDSSIL